ncbi:hypothetical protein N431DRAFT_549865 [Stipitochalara longipes BDJ]|nr:hypothetical protein N431DRAFT_549865 [Stipitochalara longipes BDJ]
MDRIWIPKLWRQTATNTKVEIPAAALTRTFEMIAARTAELVKKPYNAGLWASRAALLIRVGYPELAAEDARKAQKLLTAMLDGKGAGLVARKQILETPGAPKAPGLLFSFPELYDPYRFIGPGRCFSQFPGNVYSLRRDLQQSPVPSQINADEQMLFGSASFHQYPFIPLEYIQRSAGLIAINAPCMLRASSFGSPAPSSALSPPSKSLGQWKSLKQFFGLEAESETLGLFAVSAIQKGDVILKDPTTWSGRTFTMFCCENCGGVTPFSQNTIYQSQYCNTKYCSNGCLEMAKANYHQVLCGKDFSWLVNKPQLGGVKSAPAGLSDTDGHMWLRILATCVQSGLHPLEHPSIAALTPNYGSDDDVGRRWSLASHIDVPQRILTALGVDIFRDLKYDTWVLQTIWARMVNNQHGGVEQGLNDSLVSRSVNPLYSFVNHSCEPNAEARDIHETYPPQTAPVIGSSAIAIIAKRDIILGEDICISYIDEHQNRAQRNLLLRSNWLSGDCLCTRCQREA